MKTISISSRIGALLATSFLLMPLAAFAASISLETAPGTVSTGDTIVVKAYVDTDAAPANALDGTINLSPAGSVLTVKTISLANSILTLWPHSPAVSADGTNISFTGGLPGGFTGTHLLLFTMVLNATSPGAASLTPADSVLYLNDGKGTATPVSGKALAIAVQPAQAGTAPHDEWQSTVSGDTTPPEPFTISVGQDPSVFGGKRYIFFQTTDGQSGIDHYMVKEGSAAPVESSSTYVLQDQTSPVTIIVYAYDKAGNVRTSTYTSTASTSKPATIPLMVPLLLLAFAALLLIAYGVCRYTKRTPKA